MQPTMMVKPRRSASAASASASVSPPVLSSLMLTASYLPTSASSDARSCTLSSAQTGIGALDAGERGVAAFGQRLLDQRHAGIGAGREILRQIVGRPALVGVDDQLGPRRGAAHRGDPAPSPSPPPSLTLSSGRDGRPLGRLGHGRGRGERNRIGRDPWLPAPQGRPIHGPGGRPAWR